VSRLRGSIIGGLRGGRCGAQAVEVAVEVAVGAAVEEEGGEGGEAAVGDTKAPVAGTYAHLRVSTADLGGLLAGIKSGSIV
jgi:hypothetical protein